MSTTQRNNMKQTISGIEWEVLDPSNIPEGLVMAANFDEGSLYFNERLVGFLHKHTFGDHVAVRDDLAPKEMNIQIPRVTHYIKL